MTLFAARDEHMPDTINISMTYGPLTAQVKEEVGHAAYFWHQLGQVLGAAKHTVLGAPEQRARAGYERYRASAGGRSRFTGEPLPEFDEQDADIKAHWVAAFTEG